MPTSMLRRNCPNCSRQVNLLGEEWRSQKSSKRKVCPFCGAGLVSQFKGSTFGAWCLGFLVASVLGGYLFGAQVAALLFVSAFIVPLVASIHLYRDA